MKLFVTFLLAAFMGPPLVSAKDVSVAVAANFAAPMEKISALFSAETGHKLIISYGATGKFFAQIKNGAPFEVFLSADQNHPKKLVDEKLASKGTQFTYATGKLVLWSPKLGFVDPTGEVLKSGNFKHIAIANPKLAPYGAAAQEALEKKGLWKTLQAKIVFGESIAQAYQFVSTGNAELGFVALSQVKGDAKGSFWMIPQDLYSPLLQDAILLEKAKDNAVAKKFLEFLKSPKAKKIITDFGYEL